MGNSRVKALIQEVDDLHTACAEWSELAEERARLLAAMQRMLVEAGGFFNQVCTDAGYETAARPLREAILALTELPDHTPDAVATAAARRVAQASILAVNTLYNDLGDVNRLLDNRVEHTRVSRPRLPSFPSEDLHALLDKPLSVIFNNDQSDSEESGSDESDDEDEGEPREDGNVVLHPIAQADIERMMVARRVPSSLLEIPNGAPPKEESLIVRSKDTEIMEVPDLRG